MLLPHDEFVFAELKRDGANQTLRRVFVTTKSGSVASHYVALRRPCNGWNYHS